MVDKVLDSKAGGSIIIGVIVIVAIIGGLASIKFLGPNNPVEETAEEIIKIETGGDVNLSGHPEKK